MSMLQYISIPIDLHANNTVKANTCTTTHAPMDPTTETFDY